ANGRVAATLSDGARLSADHVLLATGYRVNVNRLPMLHASLRAELMTDGANPILNHWFESSIPGLYFVGVTSLRAFGPLYRFVAGGRGAGGRGRAPPAPPPRASRGGRPPGWCTDAAGLS